MFKLLLIVISFNSYAFLPKQFKAEFKQIIKSKRSKKERYITGNIDYLFPGHIRFEVKKPNPSIYVSNNKKTWYYRPPFIEGEEGQVTIQSSKRSPIHRVFDVMKSGLKSNKDYSVKSSDQDQVTLLFSKKFSKLVGMSKTELFFQGPKSFANIKKIRLYYNRGKKVDMQLSNLKTSETQLSKSNFNFKIPEKTKVIRQ